MSTPNFFFNDTLYALDNSGEGDAFLYQDTVDNIRHSLDKFKDLEYVRVFFDNDSSAKGSSYYGGMVVVECCGYIDIKNLIGNEYMQFAIRQQIVIRSGKYIGFNLDRYYEDADKEYCETFDEMQNHFEQYCDDYLDLDGLFDEEDKDKDLEAQEEYLEEVVKHQYESQLEAIGKEFDKVYHSLGQEFFIECGVTAQFSNGETLYSEV